MCPNIERYKPTSALEGVGEYHRNVQTVELNALNAALAVIRWKKWRGLYLDLEGETQSTYTLDGNHLANSGNKSSDVKS